MKKLSNTLLFTFQVKPHHMSPHFLVTGGMAGYPGRRRPLTRLIWNLATPGIPSKEASAIGGKFPTWMLHFAMLSRFEVASYINEMLLVLYVSNWDHTYNLFLVRTKCASQSYSSNLNNSLLLYHLKKKWKSHPNGLQFFCFVFEGVLTLCTANTGIGILKKNSLLSTYCFMHCFSFPTKRRTKSLLLLKSKSKNITEPLPVLFIS